MGEVYTGVPKDFVRILRHHFHIDYFVETGTYHGDTAYWASQLFSQVYTVEAAEALHRAARDKYPGVPNLHFLLGESGAALKELLPGLPGPALFWLDAHWSRGVTYGEGQECPVLAEVEAINASGVEHFILIDDANLFLKPPPEPHDPQQWPDLVTLLGPLAAGGRFVAVLDDVLLAVPQAARAEVIHILRRQPEYLQRYGVPVRKSLRRFAAKTLTKMAKQMR
ncbi:MAG: hypothetical protein VB089_07190 [Anaerolineaceae bacterium]|jgi:hypothetical protein|nr:hypothetical protein [Anaerolineaceae bacterium]